MKNNLKVIYMGTPEFAVPALEALKEGGYDVRLAVTQPDKARGRGKKVKFTPVKETALKAGIPVEQPKKIKNNEKFIEIIREIAPDMIIVAAYGKILPPDLLALPRLGCINIHASLLPRFRGAAPVQRSIIAGDEKTGVTLMYMSEGLDTGDMIASSETVTGKKTAGELSDELSRMGAELLMEYLPRIASGDVKPVKQQDELATYAPMIAKEEGRIDFRKSAVEIERLIRGLNPWPGAFADYNGVQMKLKAADAAEADGGAVKAPDAETAYHAPGTVIGTDKRYIYIACGEGVLRVSEIQMPGKRSMSAADYFKGNKIEQGTVLGG